MAVKISLGLVYTTASVALEGVETGGHDIGGVGERQAAGGGQVQVVGLHLDHLGEPLLQPPRLLHGDHVQVPRLLLVPALDAPQVVQHLQLLGPRRTCRMKDAGCMVKDVGYGMHFMVHPGPCMQELLT